MEHWPSIISFNTWELYILFMVHRSAPRQGRSLNSYIQQWPEVHIFHDVSQIRSSQTSKYRSDCCTLWTNFWCLLPSPCTLMHNHLSVTVLTHLNKPNSLLMGKIPAPTQLCALWCHLKLRDWVWGSGHGFSRGSKSRTLHSPELPLSFGEVLVSSVRPQRWHISILHWCNKWP